MTRFFILTFAAPNFALRGALPHSVLHSALQLKKSHLTDSLLQEPDHNLSLLSKNDHTILDKIFPPQENKPEEIKTQIPDIDIPDTDEFVNVPITTQQEEEEKDVNFKKLFTTFEEVSKSISSEDHDHEEKENQKKVIDVFVVTSPSGGVFFNKIAGELTAKRGKENILTFGHVVSEKSYRLGISLWSNLNNWLSHADDFIRFFKDVVLVELRARNEDGLQYNLHLVGNCMGGVSLTIAAADVIELLHQNQQNDHANDDDDDDHSAKFPLNIAFKSLVTQNSPHGKLRNAFAKSAILADWFLGMWNPFHRVAGGRATRMQEHRVNYPNLTTFIDKFVSNVETDAWTFCHLFDVLKSDTMREFWLNQEAKDVRKIAIATVSESKFAASLESSTVSGSQLSDLQDNTVYAHAATGNLYEGDDYDYKNREWDLKKIEDTDRFYALKNGRKIPTCWSRFCSFFSSSKTDAIAATPVWESLIFVSEEGTRCIAFDDKGLHSDWFSINGASDFTKLFCKRNPSQLSDEEYKSTSEIFQKAFNVRYHGDKIIQQRNQAGFWSKTFFEYLPKMDKMTKTNLQELFRVAVAEKKENIGYDLSIAMAEAYYEKEPSASSSYTVVESGKESNELEIQRFLVQKFLCKNSTLHQKKPSEKIAKRDIMNLKLDKETPIQITKNASLPASAVIAAIQDLAKLEGDKMTLKFAGILNGLDNLYQAHGSVEVKNPAEGLLMKVVAAGKKGNVRITERG